VHDACLLPSDVACPRCRPRVCGAHSRKRRNALIAEYQGARRGQVCQPGRRGHGQPERADRLCDGATGHTLPTRDNHRPGRLNRGRDGSPTYPARDSLMVPLDIPGARSTLTFLGASSSIRRSGPDPRNPSGPAIVRPSNPSMPSAAPTQSLRYRRQTQIPTPCRTDGHSRDHSWDQAKPTR